MNASNEVRTKGNCYTTITCIHWRIQRGEGWGANVQGSRKVCRSYFENNRICARSRNAIHVSEVLASHKTTRRSHNRRLIHYNKS